MAVFDTLIRGGTIIDGTRAPRFVGDVGIRDGRIAAIGRLGSSSAPQVIDADGAIVAPGFVDLHTHYDAQIFWDPYCTISGWHGVTTVVHRQLWWWVRSGSTRHARAHDVVAHAGRGDPTGVDASGPAVGLAVTFPGVHDETLRRVPKGLNVMSYLPLGAVLVWVLGLDDAKAGPDPDRRASSTAIRRILHEAMDAGAAGWSAQRLPPHGGMSATSATTTAPRCPPTTCRTISPIELAQRCSVRTQPGVHPDEPDRPAIRRPTARISRSSPESRDGRFSTTSCRPTTSIRTAIATSSSSSNAAGAEGLRVYGQAHMTAAGLTWTFEDWNLFDDSDAWMEATTGTIEEKHRKLADPARREAAAHRSVDRA